MNRRAFLESMALSAAVVFPLRLSALVEEMHFPVASPLPDPAFLPNVELEIVAQPSRPQIFPGRATDMWSYTAKLLKGPSGTVQDLDCYLGPAIHLRKGDKVRVHFRNQLPESSIIHWHGLNVPEKADGHPRLAVPTGAKYLYEFEVIDRAGNYMYHPHPHERTASEVYAGLAGVIYVHDDEEDALKLPSGDHDIPIVIQDRTFGDDNRLIYLTNEMERMNGFLGDRILVNGKVDTELKLGTGVYRLRILNASNSRIYKLAWSNGMQFTVIGTDGGLLERPVQKPYLALAPAERADVIVNLGQQSVGSTLELRSASFPAAQMMMGGMGRGMGGMGGGAKLPLGAEFRVLRVKIDRRETSDFRLPARLSNPGFLRVQDAVNASQPRVYTLSMMHMQFFINGKTFRMDEVADNEIFKAGQTYLLEFRNQGMGMMQMAHPLHMHGGQYQVVKRVPPQGGSRMAAALSQGLNDGGWKDTVLIFPGETVQLLMKMPEYKGLFLYHCHILEHEDMGMMRNFRVV